MYGAKEARQQCGLIPLARLGGSRESLIYIYVLYLTIVSLLYQVFVCEEILLV